MSLSFLPYFLLPGIAQPNDTINKKERVPSHLPRNHPNLPFRPCPPSEAACSEGSIPMTTPTQTRHRFLPWILESKIHELYPIGYGKCRRRSSGGSGIPIWSGGAVTNYSQHLWDVLIRLWHFPLPIETLLPYGWSLFFWSHTSAKFGTG